MSELPAGIPRAEPPEPRESALGILLRRGEDGGLEVLLGRRSRRSGFLPGHHAFLGGRLDEQDEPERPGAWERCASREIEEEARIQIEPGDWHDAGERTTPPIFPVRYRTVFLLAEMPAGSEVPSELPSPEEIETLEFLRPAAVLEDWQAGRVLVPPPVLLMLRALATNGPAEAAGLAALLRKVNESETELPRVEFLHDIWLLPVRTATLPPASHTNVWMPGGGRFAIVDPGADEAGELERLAAMAGRRREAGSEPAAVVLTHHHADHTSGTAWLAQRLGLPVHAHPETFARLELGGTGVELIEMGEGETLDLEGLTLVARHTPGHAPGHLAFEVPERRAVLTGDLLSGLSTILIDPDDGDMGQYLDSLRLLDSMKGRRFLPSHGPPLPWVAAGKLLNHRLERESRVVAALAGGRSVELGDIARHAYKDQPDAPVLLKEMQALAHLRHLESKDEAVPDDEDGRWWKEGRGQDSSARG